MNVRWGAIGILLTVAGRGAAAEPPPLALADGELAARLALELSLAPAQVGHAEALAPDVWWGATPELTVGVITSTASLDRVAAGWQLGVDARYALVRRGGLAVAPRVRILARDVSPWKPAATAGALAIWRLGDVWSLAADPYLQLGLANTDLGNRAQLVVPVYATARVACRWQVDLETGYASELAVWHDGYHVPLALDVVVHATPSVDVGVQAGFTSLVGPQDNLGEREAWLVISFRRS